MNPLPSNNFPAYHAHVYFNAQTLEAAKQLCQSAGAAFDISVGRIHQKPVGPHPDWSCQLKFTAAQFDLIIPWLEAHRNGLNILVHGLTGNDLKDHTEHASWLGQARPLNLAIFRT